LALALIYGVTPCLFKVAAALTLDVGEPIAAELAR
jgi:hypothetical protein